MKKQMLDEHILKEAVCMAAERELDNLDTEMQNKYHTFTPQFEEKMQRLLQENAHVFGNEKVSFLQKLQRSRKKREKHHIFAGSRYILVAVLLMVLASAAALASEDVREGLRKLSIQFSSNGVSIEGAKNENAAEENSADDEQPFRAYRWKNVPEGYHLVNETEEPESRMYTVWYQNKEENNLHFMQHDASIYTVTITCNEEEGYKRKIDLNGTEAYSVSSDRDNSIFFEKDGYIFTIMSEQPEEIIVEWIKNSGILQE